MVNRMYSFGPIPMLTLPGDFGMAALLVAEIFFLSCVPTARLELSRS